jgi:hypothetical protein
LICLAGTTSGALGNIYVWTENAEGCTIDHVNNTIQINEPDTYGFRAWNPQTEALEDIQDITIDSGVDDEVTVMIAYDEYGDNGAVNLRQGNLTVDGYEVYLAGLEISGNVATTGDFICDNITGTVDIDGDIGVTAGTRKFFVQNATAPIIVCGRLLAYNTLEAETLGDLTVYGQPGLPVQGDITITNTYAGTLFIDHRFDGDLTIGDPNDPNDPNDAYVVSHVTGEVNIAGISMGKTLVTGDVASGALIAVRSGGTEMGDALYNAIEIQGSLAGLSHQHQAQPKQDCRPIDAERMTRTASLL